MTRLRNGLAAVALALAAGCGDSRIPEAARLAHDASLGSELVTVPSRADERFVLVDPRSGLSLEASLVGARSVAGERRGDARVFAGGAPGGADLVEHLRWRGLEDDIVFARRPERNELAYDVVLSERVAGLRAVDGVVELVDASGTPRLRVARPFVVGVRGDRHPAELSIEGCAFDTNPAAPWRHAPVAPGARRCRFVVRWGSVAYPATVDPLWTLTDSMTEARAEFPAVVLANGDVLVCGGRDAFGGPNATADLYDVQTHTFAATGAMPQPRSEHTATVLADGSVLVVGGENLLTIYASAIRYDPAAGSFALAATMALARTAHTATRLSDGTVLVAGGSNAMQSALASAERFDPATSSFAPAATMNEPRSSANAALLGDGRVLIAGGNAVGVSSTTELYDRALDTWTYASGFNDPRSNFTLTPLSDGRLLMAGGLTLSYSIATANVFDPMTGAWMPVDPLPTARDSSTATLLGDGKVLVAGGECTGFNCQTDGIIYHDAFLFDGASGSWQAAGAMVNARESHAAVPLPGDRVLQMGGDGLSSAEIFSRGAIGQPCTTGIDCESGFCADGLCCASACTGLCEACSSAKKGSGQDGTCGPVAAGTDPNGDCPDDGSPTCGRDGACDGNGACETYPGAGCTPKPCTTASDCASGHCADGICCNAACDVPCETCVAAKGSSTDGLCQPVPKGTDPDGDCPGAGSGTCDGLSLCDGNGVCAMAALACAPYACESGTCLAKCSSDAECAVAHACVSGKCTPEAASCSGHVATDATGKQTDCTPYTCTANGACRTSCGSVDDCVSPNVCDSSGHCVPRESSTDQSGCSCRVAGAPIAPSRWAALFTALAVAVAAHRRRRGRARATGE